VKQCTEVSASIISSRNKQLGSYGVLGEMLMNILGEWCSNLVSPNFLYEPMLIRESNAMKQLIIFLLIGIWLCLLGCGEEETPVPTIVKDITPPTIIAVNVQGGPIPVNTPIVLVFSERVNLTSAQRGILVRSSIDAETIKGVITLDKGGLEVKFTPVEKMTSGAYVLTVLGIEDSEGNVLMTPFSIFFSAVEVDTTKPPADVMPPGVVSSTPSEGQSVKSTGSLVVRFDEEVDVTSAQAGIVVSGVEGTVEVSGVVAIFKPQKPMAVGKHTLAIVGIRDLAGNVMASSLLIPFEVIAPLPEITPPSTGRPSKGGVSWEAENFAARKGNSIQVLKPPLDTADSDGKAYRITEASGGAFIGNPNGGAADSDGSWVKYEFNVPKGGDWYFWGRAIATTGSDDSFFWMIDGADADARAEDNDKTNIWDFNEQNNCPLGPACAFSTNWLWFRLSARVAGPFPVGPAGSGIDYANPIPLTLTAGKHTLHVINRESGTFLDWFFATMDKTFDANKTAPDLRTVEMQGKLAATWGQLKWAR